jgi:hypothetical protein
MKNGAVSSSACFSDRLSSTFSISIPHSPFPIPHSHFYGGGKTPLSRPKNGGCVIEVARVVFKEGKPSDVEDFVAGWMKDGRVLGRPAVLITGVDGALYVSDDNKGFM